MTAWLSPPRATSREDDDERPRVGRERARGRLDGGERSADVGRHGPARGLEERVQVAERGVDRPAPREPRVERGHVHGPGEVVPDRGRGVELRLGLAEAGERVGVRPSLPASAASPAFASWPVRCPRARPRARSRQPAPPMSHGGRRSRGGASTSRAWRAIVSGPYRIASRRRPQRDRGEPVAQCSVRLRRWRRERLGRPRSRPRHRPRRRRRATRARPGPRCRGRPRPPRGRRGPRRRPPARARRPRPRRRSAPAGHRRTGGGRRPRRCRRRRARRPPAIATQASARAGVRRRARRSVSGSYAVAGRPADPAFAVAGSWSRFFVRRYQSCPSIERGTNPNAR